MDRQTIREHVRLATLIEDTNVTDTQINAIINQGILEISVAQPWQWLQDTDLLTVTDSTRTIALPSDFLYGAALVDNDYETRITYLSPSVFFTRFGDGGGTENDRPEFFTTWSSSIYLYPIPIATEASRLTLYFYKEPTTLSADGTEPQFQEAFHWILVEYAKWKLYEREEYYDQSERSFISYSRYLADMIDWYSSRFKYEPFAIGDGVFGPGGDKNIPFLDRI